MVVHISTLAATVVVGVRTGLTVQQNYTDQPTHIIRMPQQLYHIQISAVIAMRCTDLLSVC